MKRIWRSLILATGLALAAPVAVAADWEGPYVGVYGATVDWGAAWAYGGNAGYNFSLGSNVYAGAEVDVFYTQGGELITGVNARLAYEVTPDLLVFGLAGFAAEGVTTWWVAGAGAEYMVIDNVSLRAEVDRYDQIGAPSAHWVVKAGIAYHF